MRKTVIVLVLCSLGFQSCDFFVKEENGVPIARVNGSYLYEEDIESLLATGMTARDSALVVNGFINRWATQQLLMNGAKINISNLEQQRFDRLVEQYKMDLYAQAYKDALVVKGLDSIITEEESTTFYEGNIGNFKLNEELLRLRYIKLGETDYNVKDIKQKFIRFDPEDKKYLDSLSVQFKETFLNDSTWVSRNSVVEKVWPITLENADRYLKKTQFLQLRDSLGLYLIAIEETLERNEDAPLSYVLPTVRQIILNKRKLELLKQLEKDITKDAIKNKQFEIYN